jgi:transcription antitermination factor NusG
LSHWFAIRTTPQRELTLAGRHDEDGVWLPGLLERRGYQVFCPTEVKFRKTIRKGRRVSIPRLYPMFTGYIFIGGSFSWQHLLAENHIQGVVGFPDSFGNRRPAPISESEMEKLRAMSGGLVPHRRSVNTHRAFRVGEDAAIAYGPFAHQIVKIAGLHGSKARVFLNLFGGTREVEVDLEMMDVA